MLPFLYLSFPHADYGRRTIVSVCGMGVDLAFRARTRSSWCILVRGEVPMRIVVIHHIPHLSFVVRYTLPLNHLEIPTPSPAKISVSAGLHPPNESNYFPPSRTPSTIRFREYLTPRRAHPPPPGIREEPESPHGNPFIATPRNTDPSAPTRCPT